MERRGRTLSRFGDDAEPLAGRAGMGVGDDAYRQHGG